MYTLYILYTLYSFIFDFKSALIEKYEDVRPYIPGIPDITNIPAKTLVCLFRIVSWEYFDENINKKRPCMISSPDTSDTPFKYSTAQPLFREYFSLKIDVHDQTIRNCILEL